MGKGGRLPLGLTAACFVATVSVGLLVVLWNMSWPVAGGLELLVHGSAALCLGWSIISLALRRTRILPTGGNLEADTQAVLQIAMIVTGLAVVILMVYTAATEVLYRTPYLMDYQAPWRIHVWRTGLVDLGLVTAAIILAWARWRDPQLITLCFWALVLVGLWLSLQIPMTCEVHTPTGASYVDSTPWAVPFIVTGSLLLAGFSLGEGFRRHQRRVRAWPDALAHLTRESSIWPGFYYSVGIIAVAILLLGCMHIVSPWTPPACLIAGIAILTMVTRRWEEGLADVALGLITLSIVSLPMAWLPVPLRPMPQYFAELFNRAIFGLAVMTAVWHWLAGVWEQQLDDGQPWTTTGRLIRNSLRMGYLSAATAVLVSLHLAFWPRISAVVADLDNSPWRWSLGLAACLLTLLALGWSTCRTGKITLAYLALFQIGATSAFAIIRLGDSTVTRWVVLYWPLLMTFVAGLAVLVAAAVFRWPRGRAFITPLLVLGLLAAPTAAILGATLLGKWTMPAWMPTVVAGLLTIIYLTTAFFSGVKGYILFAAVCATLAIWSWR